MYNQTSNYSMNSYSMNFNVLKQKFKWLLLAGWTQQKKGMNLNNKNAVLLYIQMGLMGLIE